MLLGHFGTNQCWLAVWNIEYGFIFSIYLLFSYSCEQNLIGWGLFHIGVWKWDKIMQRWLELPMQDLRELCCVRLRTSWMQDVAGQWWPVMAFKGSLQKSGGWTAGPMSESSVSLTRSPKKLQAWSVFPQKTLHLKGMKGISQPAMFDCRMVSLFHFSVPSTKDHSVQVEGGHNSWTLTTSDWVKDQLVYCWYWAFSSTPKPDHCNPLLE